MKILVVTQYYEPEQFLINDIVPELEKRGHQVTVLTGLPNYPRGDLYSGYEDGKERTEMRGGVRVIRVRERPRKKGTKNLFLNYLSFAVRACQKVRSLEGDFDLVFCYQLSPVLVLEPAVLYARRNRKPLLAYCLDLWPASAEAHLKSPFLYALVKRKSAVLYQRCNWIAVTSKPFIRYLEKTCGCSSAGMSYLPQHADGSMLDMDLTAPGSEISSFMYAGNLGKGQELDVVIKAAAELKNRNDFIIHIVGDGSQRQKLEKLAEELEVSDRFVFYGNRERKTMPGYYRRADALLITLRGDNAVGETMPGKLQTYMTAGKPVLGAINGAASEVIRESNCGKCVPAGDYKGLSELMEEYMDHPEHFSACGRNGRDYFKEHFTLSRYMDDLEDCMVHLTGLKNQV